MSKSIGLKQYLRVSPEEEKQLVFIKKDPKNSDIVFLILNRGKANAFNPEFVRAIQECLDQVEKIEGDVTMITSTINDRIFSGGLDLQFLMTSSTQERHSFLLEFIRLLGRLIVFPVPTIALINGFALAGGCMLSFCHDYRFMRKDLGNMAMTEIELGMPLPPGMNAVVQAKVNNDKIFKRIILQAERFDEKKAFENGLIDGGFSAETIVEEVVKFGKSLSKFGANKSNYKQLKEEMYKNAVDCCFNKGLAVGVRAQEINLGQPKL